MKSKISIKEELKNYKDLLANEIVAFKLIEGVVDEIIEEIYKKILLFQLKIMIKW